ncbi:MAG: ABC transporter permease [Planctomycetota bacterium]|jgi:ribose/xylose/arabinose/galactoside ABC-type transport system permease subunit
MSKFARQLLPFGSLTLIICILSVLRPDTFLTAGNFLNVLRRSSVNGIIAIGMTAVIISAGIDLSVGSMLALAGMAGAYAMVALGSAEPTTAVMVAGTIVGVIIGTLCGFVNGWLITRLKLQPFIVTLGTMSAFRGISYVMNNGEPYNVPDYTYLGEGVVLGVPISVLIFAVIIAIASFILRYTRLGRYTYAIGSNREAAFHAGVNVNRNLVYIYTLTGLMVGIAAMIATSRTVSAQPTAGIALELDIIASVVIGGASLAGGRGTITGTIIGTLLISFLRNGCTLLGISTNVQLIVIGGIIIAAVALDQLARSKAKAGAVT